MNKTIEQLAEQAWIADCIEQFPEYKKNEITEHLLQDMEGFHKKFAELIVQQCIDQIEIERGNPYRNMGDENKYGISACDQSISRIKQHFGFK